MSDQPLRGAIIGCGYVARFHLEGWCRHADAHIVACCDRDLTRAEGMARRFAIPHHYQDADRLFREQRLDFVDIATRPESHAALIELAAKNRVAVICQKPIAEDLPTIDRLIAICDQRKIRCMVHENWRFRPWYPRMAEAIAQGIVGRPVRLRVSSRDFRCLAPGGMSDQPYFAEMPRFILLEMGPHLVDVARHLFGEPRQVFAALGRCAPLAGEDSAHLVLGYADGKIALLDMCWSTAGERDDRLQWGLFDTVVEGDRGTLRVDAKGQLSVLYPDGTGKTLPVELSNDPRVDSYAATERHFLDRLADGAPFVTDLTDNRRAMRSIFAAYVSAEKNCLVPLDESAPASRDQ